MTIEGKTRKDMWTWGVPASLVAHAVIALAILVGVSIEDVPQPEPDEAVNVEIVQPPEQEEASKPLPEQPAAKQASAEKAEPEPEQQPAPPPPSPERAEEPSVPPAEPTATPPAAPEQAAKPRPQDSFRPVFQFGEKDEGPKIARDGEAERDETEGEGEPEAEHASPAEARPDKEAEPAAGQDASETSDQQADADPESEEQVRGTDGSSDEPPAAPVPEVLAAAGREGGPADSNAVGRPVPAAAPGAAETPTASTSGGQARPVDAPVDKSDTKPKPAPLRQAKRLYSSRATDNPVVVEAMGRMSRSERAGALCNTELGEQLVRGSPAYRPRDLPRPRLDSGNVIDVKAAFSAGGQWYDVSFRCEVDKGATKVVSFAHQVGATIPKSEWRRRGFPAY